MRSAKRQPQKNNSRTDSSAERIFRLVADDIGSLFPYALIFFVATLVAAAFVPTMANYFYWPAFYAIVALLGFFAFSSAAFRLAGRAEQNARPLNVFTGLRDTTAEVVIGIYSAFGATMPRRNRWLWIDYVKGALAVALVGWAVAAGAPIVDVLVLAYGCSVVLFKILDERVPYAVAAVSIVALPIMQNLVSRDILTIMTAAVFELFATAIIYACVRLYSEKSDELSTGQTVTS